MAGRRRTGGLAGQEGFGFDAITLGSILIASAVGLTLRRLGWI